MYSDSRKAQYNSFAHHRAHLLLSELFAEKGEVDSWSDAIHEGTEPREISATVRQHIPAGILNAGRSAQAALS
jgi:hypothetical protein